MSYSISTLLTRNLNDVFGENNPARRRTAIDEIFTEDCVFYEPNGVHRGRDGIDRIAGAIRVTHHDFRYQPIAEPGELGNGGRGSDGYRAALARRQLRPGRIFKANGRNQSAAIMSAVRAPQFDDGKIPLPPKAELEWWYQFYFATERGRDGYDKKRHRPLPKP